MVLLHRELFKGGQMHGVTEERNRIDEEHVDRAENAAFVHGHEAAFVDEGHCAGRCTPSR